MKWTSEVRRCASCEIVRVKESAFSILAASVAPGQQMLLVLNGMKSGVVRHVRQINIRSQARNGALLLDMTA